jgi:hypothetical protein
LIKSRHARLNVISRRKIVKKIFLLFLCLVAVAGFVFAGTLHPPGAPALALPGYGVHEAAVTPGTVLAAALLTYGLPDQILVVSDIMASGLPKIVFGITIGGQALLDVPAADVDYPLRL